MALTLKREKRLVFANAACYGYSNGFIGKAINYSSLFTGIYLLDTGALAQYNIYVAILVYWMASEVREIIIPSNMRTQRSSAREGEREWERE